MEWYKISISTTIYAQDFVSGILYDKGIAGIEIINNTPLTQAEKEEMFIDILPEVDENDKSAEIIFYLEYDQNLEDMIKEIEVGLETLKKSGINIGSGSISITITKDEDWANNWKEYFKAFRVADDIIIKPSWENDFGQLKINDNDIIIEIDPEMAFGTGSHETTRLAIDGIKKYLKYGQNILDLGCGSGILSIVSKKLGADKVTATEIDKNALEVAKENVQVNNISLGDIRIFHGDVLNEEISKQLDKQIGLGDYDIVVANILADVIIDLAEIVDKYLKSDGLFIATGILESQVDSVKEAFEKNKLHVIEVNTRGDWVSLIGKY